VQQFWETLPPTIISWERGKLIQWFSFFDLICLHVCYDENLWKYILNVNYIFNYVNKKVQIINGKNSKSSIT
jgi:hypothetical protein